MPKARTAMSLCRLLISSEVNFRRTTHDPHLKS